MVLERALRSGVEMNVITFDPMQRLKDYRDTGLYVLLVRADNGAIIGGNINDEVASSISTEIYEVPIKFREKVLTSEQAIVYNKNSIAYVNVERS